VRNDPITGPVISGPHQEPFICRTTSMGLGEPIDEHCSIQTRVQWFSLSAAHGASFQELEDPYAPYPADTLTTVTTEGEVVPYVVRVETNTINLASSGSRRQRARGPRSDASSGLSRDAPHARSAAEWGRPAARA
jgi:hypothetical protein